MYINQVEVLMRIATCVFLDFRSVLNQALAAILCAGIESSECKQRRVKDFHAWITDIKHDLPPYPASRCSVLLIITAIVTAITSHNRFKGKGIVLTTTMGIIYAASLFVQLRVLRKTVKTKLPIEVYYASVPEAPAVIMETFRSTFPDVKFINIYSLAEVAQGSFSNCAGFFGSVLLNCDLNRRQTEWLPAEALWAHVLVV